MHQSSGRWLALGRASLRLKPPPAFTSRRPRANAVEVAAPSRVTVIPQEPRGSRGSDSPAPERSPRPGCLWHSVRLGTFQLPLVFLPSRASIISWKEMIFYSVHRPPLCPLEKYRGRRSHGRVRARHASGSPFRGSLLALGFSFCSNMLSCGAEF